VDIGCGMCAIPLTTDAAKLRAEAVRIKGNIRRDVPIGFSHNREETVWEAGRKLARTNVVQALIDDGCFKQIGSLGGGNHFIEIGIDAANQPWIIIHSGSRNVGKRVADHYVAVAHPEGKVKDGHDGLRVDSPEGQDYLTDMAFALEFALANRYEIVRRVANVITRYAGGEAIWDRLINRNHNHAEEKDGLWVHRKGATHAEQGMFGVIPGNMRDGAFIVKGRGNPNSLWSSSHGAGRILARGAAKRTLNLDDFKKSMEGIVADVCEATLDESPDAYKPIFDVMAAQSDLVEIVAHVRPVINVKDDTPKRDKKNKKAAGGTAECE
jgi:tRNA-splicing ligase RtcB